MKKATVETFHGSFETFYDKIKFSIIDHVLEALKILEIILFRALLPSNDTIYIIWDRK